MDEDHKIVLLDAAKDADGRSFIEDVGYRTEGATLIVYVLDAGPNGECYVRRFDKQTGVFF